jgi:hypothetical protein
MSALPPIADINPHRLECLLCANSGHSEVADSHRAAGSLYCVNALPHTEGSAINLKFNVENEMSVSTNKSLFTACLAMAGLFLTAPVSAEKISIGPSMILNGSRLCPICLFPAYGKKTPTVTML